MFGSQCLGYYLMFEHIHIQVRDFEQFSLSNQRSLGFD